MKTYNVFLNCLEQLLHRKLLIAALIITIVFLSLFTWALIEANNALDESANVIQTDAPIGTDADVAIAALFTAFPMAAIIIVGLSVIVGSSLLPEELSSGRLSFLCSLPLGRFSAFTGFISASLFATFLIGLFLMGGIVLITAIIFPYQLTSVPEAVVSFFIWIFVPWAFISALSLKFKRMPSIILTFGLFGVSSFLGGLGQLGRFFQTTGRIDVQGLITAGNIGALIFPLDTAYRSLLHGITPANSLLSEPLAFFGATETPDIWKMGYTVLWSFAALYISWRKFSRMELP